MVLFALLALLLLAVAPFVAALSELAVSPGALMDVLFSQRLAVLEGWTVLLGLTVALLAMLVGVPVGRALARSRSRTGRVLASLLPVPLVLPPWLAGIAWLSVLPLAGFWGATFLLVASLWPLVALFAMRGFAAAGRATDAAELARGRAQASRRVELPLALPSILSGALLVFIFAVTDFSVVDLLSFSSSKPFVVLSSEIFQKWARVDNATDVAAAVSLASIVPSALALIGVLLLERRHEGHARGAARSLGRPRPVGPAGAVGLVAVGLSIAVPLAVLVGQAWGSAQMGQTLSAARGDTLRSVGGALATGAAVALLGLLVARAQRKASPRVSTLLLALALLPLAAPGVMFAVGEIRLWNAPWNPLSDAVYPSAALLVLALAGRYLALGVLSARAVLARQDEAPLQAARLVRRPLWQRLLRVDLPLLAPATGLAFTLGYLLTLREMDMIVLIPAGSATLSHRIYSWVHLARDDVSATLCLALVLLTFVPVVAARLLGVPGVDCPGPSRDP